MNFLSLNDYPGYRGGDSPSEFSNIFIKNVNCEYAENGIHLQEIDTQPIHDNEFENVNIKEASTPFSWCEFTDNISLQAVKINGNSVEELPLQRSLE